LALIEGFHLSREDTERFAELYDATTNSIDPLSRESREAEKRFHELLAFH
jgi:hypothetical protein